MEAIHTIEEFQEKVFNAKGRVLVDFSATWCGPCQMLHPILEEVSKEFAGKIPVYTVDIDECSSFANSFGLTAVPTMVVFENGKGISVQQGLRSKDAIVSTLNNPDLGK